MTQAPKELRKVIFHLRPHPHPAPAEEQCQYDSRVNPKEQCESCRGLRPKWCTFESRPHPAPEHEMVCPCDPDCEFLKRGEQCKEISQTRDYAKKFAWMKPLCFGRHEAVCDTRCAWVVRKRCVESLRETL